MHFRRALISDAWLIDPSPHEDDRGRFLRAWCREEFASQGIDFTPLQANMGRSASAGTVRGLHYQADPHPEAKLIRCTRGAIFDVVVDLRPGSPTLGRWFGAELTADNARMVYVPPLCAHGYQTLTDDTEIYYLTSAVFAPGSVRGVRPDDPSVGIEWPRHIGALSDQDRSWPLRGGAIGP